MEERWLVGGDELLHRLAETLRQARKQIKRDNDERLVGLLDVVRVSLEGLILRQCRGDDRQASLIYRHGIFGERAGRSD